MALPSSDHTVLADSSSEFAEPDDGTRVTLELGTEPVSTQDRLGELDRLLVKLTETHPGIVRTLRVLWVEAECEMLTRHELTHLAKVLRIMAGGLQSKASAPLSPP